MILQFTEFRRLITPAGDRRFALTGSQAGRKLRFQSTANQLLNG